MKFSEEEIEELTQILKLYEGDDQESMKLGQELFRSSKAFKKADLDNSIIIDRGYCFNSKTLLNCPNSRFQAEVIDSLITKNANRQCYIYTKTNVEFTDEDKANMNQKITDYKLSAHSKNKNDEFAVIRKTIRSSNWYNKLYKNNIVVSLKNSMSVRRMIDIFYFRISSLEQCFYMKEMINGDISFYKRLEYD